MIDSSRCWLYGLQASSYGHTKIIDKNLLQAAAAAARATIQQNHILCKCSCARCSQAHRLRNYHTLWWWSVVSHGYNAYMQSSQDKCCAAFNRKIIGTLEICSKLRCHQMVIFLILPLACLAYQILTIIFDNRYQNYATIFMEVRFLSLTWLSYIFVQILGRCRHSSSNFFTRDDFMAQMACIFN